jgi:hypothetical protein
MDFQKWCTASNGSEPCYTPGQQIKAANKKPEPITLYAICKNSCDKNFTVTYDKNG